jgi:hypothetical protein
VPSVAPTGVTHEWDGPALRVCGRFRGSVSNADVSGLDRGGLHELVRAQCDFLRQLGFATITEATTYVWTPPGVTIAGAP